MIDLDSENIANGTSEKLRWKLELGQRDDVSSSDQFKW